MALCRLRENALGAITTVVRVWHADVSRKAESLDDDPSELSLREGEGLDHRDYEEREPCPLAEPFDQPHALCVCGTRGGSLVGA